MKISKEKSITFSVRLDRAEIDQISKKGIRLAPLIKNLVKDVLKRNSCPTCGSILKSKSK